MKSSKNIKLVILGSAIGMFTMGCGEPTAHNPNLASTPQPQVEHDSGISITQMALGYVIGRAIFGNSAPPAYQRHFSPDRVTMTRSNTSKPSSQSLFTKSKSSNKSPSVSYGGFGRTSPSASS